MDSRTMRGWALVGVQGLCFLAVAVTAFLGDIGPALWSNLVVSLALVVIGSAGVVWAGRDLGRALTPSPVPNEAGLVARGIYRHARHPMYSSLVVICLGVAVGSGAFLCYLSIAVLAVFFMAKARVEENYLLRAYEGYAEYGARTGRFLPGLGHLAS
ncbi:isoprenylcysteine carboxylmethyltransferase family protein [uncultured Demequina sp.]|uniref:methyltransferase family protein n=1 Tax=uncultured Demequina sp. TaxID=693499 RepID=UPI0025ECC3C1|nr:isoprenylcysteine carboxylmethyltransferase family protein [uncultured Demequina sp.]